MRAARSASRMPDRGRVSPSAALTSSRERGETRLVGRPAGEELLEEEAEGVGVARRGGRLAAGLLGAHAGRSAHQGAEGGAARVRGHPPGGAGRQRVRQRDLGRARGFGVRGFGAGEPEVQHLDLPFVRDHHVAGLQVAVDDPFLVGRLQGARHALGDGELRGGIELPRSIRLQGLAQGAAADPLQDQEVLVLILQSSHGCGRRWDGRAGRGGGLR